MQSWKKSPKRIQIMNRQSLIRKKRKYWPVMMTHMRAMGQEELESAKVAIADLEARIEILLLPKDPDDGRNVIVEIRAGTGGDEAAIFSGDLYRMYTRFAETQGWRTEMMSANEGEHGGFKEVIVRISGTDVYSRLKFESGAHRVQRVPETESRGRIMQPVPLL